MASDHDFFVLRRFAETSARVALLMQDQISELEEMLDHEDACACFDNAHSGTFRHEPRANRRAIMLKLTDKIERYRKSSSAYCVT